MPRKSYIECPNCKKRKAIEGRLLVSSERLDSAEVLIAVTDCTACRAKSVGSVVVHVPVRLVARKRAGGGFVETEEARETVTRAIEREAKLLRDRARYMLGARLEFHEACSPRRRLTTASTRSASSRSRPSARPTSR